jgi:hypothetical protein
MFRLGCQIGESNLAGQDGRNVFPIGHPSCVSQFAHAVANKARGADLESVTVALARAASAGFFVSGHGLIMAQRSWNRKNLRGVSGSAASHDVKIRVDAGLACTL